MGELPVDYTPGMMTRLSAILVGVVVALLASTAPAHADGQVTYILRSNFPQVENIFLVKGDGGTWDPCRGRLQNQDRAGEWWWRSIFTVTDSDFYPMFIVQSGSSSSRAYISCEVYWNGRQMDQTISRGAYAVASC